MLFMFPFLLWLLGRSSPAVRFFFIVGVFMDSFLPSPDFLLLSALS